MNRRQRNAIFFGILTCFISDHAQSAGPQDDVKEKVALFLSKSFTQCGDSYFSGPIERPILSCLDLSGPGRGPVQTCRELMETAKVGANPFTIETGAPFTQAQQMNGLEWHGIVRFAYPVFRTRMQENSNWLNWSEWRDQQSVPIVAELLKQHGQWFVKDLRDNGYGVTSMLVNRLKQDNLRPLSTDQEITLSGQDFVSLDQFLKSLPPLSCDDVTNPSPHAAMRPPVYQTPKFNGTIDEFAAALPGYVQQEAIARGLDPPASMKKM